MKKGPPKRALILTEDRLTDYSAAPATALT